MAEAEKKDLTIKEIREITGLSVPKFAEKYNIPKRTIQNWEANPDNKEHRKCPEYIRYGLERLVLAEYGSK